MTKDTTTSSRPVHGETLNPQIARVITIGMSTVETAAYATGWKAAMQALAARINAHRPSSIQLEISPEYNAAAVSALEWAAKQAEGMADYPNKP